VQVTIGKRMRELRLAEGWTQAELATRAGVGRATIERLERTGVITLPRLLRAAAILGVLDRFAEVIPAPTPQSIDELTLPRRMRARRKKSHGD
jgi:transcriptional regulator with XRE-family HTH domain